ncbi:hypothetical protein PR048_027515 [Dryococelus australis]|uniref:Uncharacterized protein n=1 Tax=Dryococelus australis TaxID=614101 RepID=A0ABQ9GGR1_9NEOP|nr:hypothetical protein PR048_027515 [Dryococelus australis]
MPLVGGVFSEIPRFPRLFIPPLIHPHLIPPSPAPKTPLLRAAQISSIAAVSAWMLAGPPSPGAGVDNQEVRMEGGKFRHTSRRPSGTVAMMSHAAKAGEEAWCVSWTSAVSPAVTFPRATRSASLKVCRRCPLSPSAAVLQRAALSPPPPPSTVAKVSDRLDYSPPTKNAMLVTAHLQRKLELRSSHDACLDLLAIDTGLDPLKQKSPTLNIAGGYWP